MRLPGILGLAAGLALALVLQAVILAVAHTPLAAPDLLLVLTAALGFAHGPRTAMVCGFLGGLAADLIPPATHAVGREAFVLCLVGYVAGRAAETVKDTVLRPVVLTAVLAAACAVRLLGGRHRRRRRRAQAHRAPVGRRGRRRCTPRCSRRSCSSSCTRWPGAARRATSSAWPAARGCCELRRSAAPPTAAPRRSSGAMRG